ncbi:MAG TPA: hypothetical protein VFV41_19690 [Streptosporangiaceae bacterium]|nr:hypothetical protein [Streptosporangiaceae bacterium]
MNTAQLLFLPTAARSAGLGPLGVGIVVAVFTGVGVLTDLPAGDLAASRGVPLAMLAGCVLTAGGTALFLAGPHAAAVLAAALVLGVGSSFLMNPILGMLSSLAGERQLTWQLANVCVQRSGGLLAVIVLTAGRVSGPVAPGAWATLAATAVIAALAVALWRGGRAAAEAAGPAAGAGKPAGLAGPAGQRAGPRRLAGQAVAVVRGSRDAASGLALELAIPAMLVLGFSFLPQLRAGLDGRLTAATMLITREMAGLAVVTLVVVVLRPRRVTAIVLVTLAAGAATTPLLAYAAAPAARLVAFGANGAVITVSILAANLHVYLGTTAATRITGFALAGIVSRVSGIVFPVLFGWSAGISPQALTWCALGTILVGGGLYAGLQCSQGRRDPAACPPRTRTATMTGRPLAPPPAGPARPGVIPAADCAPEPPP